MSKLNGIGLIAEERSRQIYAENWTPQHDDTHRAGELAITAACYAVVHTEAQVVSETEDGPCLECGMRPTKDAWGWGSCWDKRAKHDVLRRLAIAGALIAAEIDRIQRQEA